MRADSGPPPAFRQESPASGDPVSGESGQPPPDPAGGAPAAPPQPHPQPLLPHAELVPPIPPAPAPHPAAPSPRRLHSPARELSAAIVKSARAGPEDRVELTLDPAELGRVRFAVAREGDQLQVALQIERPETLDLLRRHSDELRQEFRAAGFGGAQLSFGRWGQGQPDTPSSDQPSAENITDMAQLAPVPPPRATANGLDLRL